jgi:beta-glucosidase
MAEIWRDATRSAGERAHDLVAVMTLDEKLAQLGCVWSTSLVADGAFSEARAGQLLRHGTGHVTRIGAATGLRPGESAAFANRIQRFLRERTRLGIPAIVHEESCAGFTARDATQFPQAIGLASTFDPELVESVAGVIRQQMRAVGARQTLAPVLDVTRDPRWGRTEETYGESPYLTSRIGVAYVRGLQTGELCDGVAATGKHFLGYGFSEGGLNHAPAHLGPRELREVAAAPFAAAIREAGLASVMNAYNEVDGLPCAGSPAILDGLLRGELGFEGVVVADYFAVRLLADFHRVAADKREAACQALRAGLDVELPALDCYGAPLRSALESGDLGMDLVDRSVERLLRLKFELGVFEDPFVDEALAPRVFDTPPQRELARRAARESIVLLKNEGALLPLAADPGRLALIGPSADDVRVLQGDYSYPAHLEMIYENRRGARASLDLLPRSEQDASTSHGGAAHAAPTFEPGPYTVRMVSLLEGIRAALAPACEVIHARGCGITGSEREGFAEAVEAARRASVAIVALGGKSGLTPTCTSGEFRDAADLGLPGVQQELLEVVVATGTPTVLVLVCGRPLALPWAAEHVPAIVQAWIPGEEGGTALAEILFGVASPSGRLPISLPRSAGQVPVHHDHKSGGGRSQMLGDYTDMPTSPLFPFGHGLTYTRFEYTELSVSEAPAVETTLEISLSIENIGDRSGEEVVQLYLGDVVASVTRPVKQLVGFARVALEPGQRRRVSFEVDPSQLAFYDVGMRLVVEPGELRVMVGASAADIRLEASMETQGKPLAFDALVRHPTRVEIS